MLLILIIAGILAWALQAVFNIYQMKTFYRELKKMRRISRVAIGRSKGKFHAGIFILLCIDDNCRIICGRKLEGLTVFAHFRDFNLLNNLILTDIDKNYCARFNKQTSHAVLSAVNDYNQYMTNVSEKGLCTDTQV
ncbi:transcriptional regulator GutM [Pectinatus sottacetonis]|uniref:transcriptional regulator GutM n=1 Tax=Pectinatus sottacetonis TaxID=1002795 RepID=UPI0018C6C1E1|nr:transcriptional regulator GutM [Pectinatus sottacetonis]